MMSRHSSAQLNYRGFTLLELLIVVSIIAILATLGFTVYGAAILSGKKVKCALQVKAIEEAANQYFQELGTYPPDTGIYEAADQPPKGLDGSSAKYAIQRYLGMAITDTKTGQQYGPYIRDMSDKNLLGSEAEVDGRKCKLYSDPWGNPYELDCTHSVRDPKTRTVVVTKPYPDGTPKEEEVLDIKAWSRGPDGKSSSSAQFFPYTKDEKDLDNIMSWTKGK